MPVNWDELNTLETAFSASVVHVSETNKDPSVYNYQDNKPFSVKRFVEKVALHVGCHLSFDEAGKITLIRSDFPSNKVFQDINSDMILSHRFEGSEKGYTDVRVLYGFDFVSGQYLKEIIHRSKEVTEYDVDVAYDPGEVVIFQGQQWVCVTGNAIGGFILSNWKRYTVNEYRLSYDYFKAVISDNDVKGKAHSISERAFLSSNITSLQVLPQIGISLVPGDKFKLKLSEDPAKTEMNVEVFQVSRIVGEVIPVKVVEIPAADVLKKGTYCTGNYCEGDYCG